MKTENEQKDLMLRKLQLESAMRMLLKVKDVTGLFNEERFNKILDDYQKVLDWLNKK